MGKSVFITGISGFAGSYLASELLSKGYEVSGTYLTEESLQNLPDKEKLKLHKLDLTDDKALFELISKIKPDFVYHLAAFTSSADSFVDPWKTMANNIKVQISILEAVRNAKINPRILVVSSAHVYGLVAKENLPIDESTPFVPTSPYAVSKITQDYLGLQYCVAYGMDIVRTRPFNHIGPKQSDNFVVSAFAKKIAEAEKNNKDEIAVGNLEPKNDFTDVRDVVVAYRLLLEKGKKGDIYNIGSGKSHAISEILNKMLSMSSKKIKAVLDPKLLRPSDNPELVCDISKIKKDTGWEPTIDLDKSLKDTLDYWRGIV